MDADTARLLVELVEKVGLLKRDLAHKKDLPNYEARVGRIDQKVAALVAAIGASNPELAKAIETAWGQPARSLAFRNRDHQREQEQQ